MKNKLIFLYAALMIPCAVATLPSAYAASEENNNTEQLKKGRALFTQICSRCHKTSYDESIVGAPGLRGVFERHDEAWLNNWIKGPEAFAKNDSSAKDLIESNKFGLAMPTIPAMQNEENRKAVIEYLKTLK